MASAANLLSIPDQNILRDVLFETLPEMLNVVKTASPDHANKMASLLAVIYNEKVDDIKSFTVGNTEKEFTLSLTSGKDEAVMRAVILLPKAIDSMEQAALDQISTGKCYSSDLAQLNIRIRLNTLIPIIRRSLDQLSQIREIKDKIRMELAEVDGTMKTL